MARETGERKRLSAADIYQGREVTVEEWPGLGVKVGILHLNCQELLDAHVEARALFRKRNVPADPWSSEELEREEMVQQVFRMLLDCEDQTGEFRVFKDAAEARGKLSPVWRAYFCARHEALYGEHAQGLDLQAMLNPEPTPIHAGHFTGEPDA